MALFTTPSDCAGDDGDDDGIAAATSAVVVVAITCWQFSL